MGRSTTAAVVGYLAGRNTRPRERDLAVCERTLDRYVQGRLVWAMLGAAPGACLLLMTVGGAVSLLPPAGLMVAIALGAAGGWLYARLDLRSDAETARRSFRHSLAAYLGSRKSPSVRALRVRPVVWCIDRRDLLDGGDVEHVGKVRGRFVRVERVLIDEETLAIHE